MRFDIPFSDYSSTRVDADRQRCVNLIPNSQRGYRQFPGLVSFSQFSAPAYASKTLSASSGPICPVFSADGLTVTSNGGGVSGMYTRTCSTAFDISTGGSLAFSSLPSFPGSQNDYHQWSQDGLRLYVEGTNGGSTGYIAEYSASTAFALTSIAYVGQMTYSAQHTPGFPASFQVSGDGTKLFVFGVVGNTSSTLYVYNLTTPYTISSATYSHSVDFSSDIDDTGAGYTAGLVLSPDGSTLLILDAVSDDVTMYQMTTGNDTATLSSAIATFSVSSQASDPQYGLSVGNSGNTMLVGDVTGNWYQYDISGYSIYDSSGLGASTTAAIVMNGIPYAVIGGGLYSFSVNGGVSFLGAMAAATGIATNGTYIMVTTGGNPFVYSAANGVQEVTDTDIGISYSCTFLDRRFIIDQPAGGFAVSDVDNPTSWNALDKATAEAYDDLVEGVKALNQVLYLFGKKTIEIWYTSGVGRPPLDRQTVLNRGVAGGRAWDDIDNSIYFLDATRRPNVLQGGQYQEIYTPALGEEWESYSKVSDVIVNCYSLDQENFAEFYFPTADVTWTYHIKSGKWIKRENTSNNAFDGSFYFEAYNKPLVVDRSTGSVLEFSSSTYQDDGSNITRTIDSGIITAEVLGAPGVDMILSEVCLTVQSSTDATISVSMSTDLATFGSARDITLISGINRLSLYQWGKFREAIIRMTTTSNAKVDIVEATGTAEVLSA